MEDGTLVTKTAFAKRCGVTQACVSKYLRDGVIGRSAIVGNGRRARIKADLALAMVRDRMDPARRAPAIGSSDSLVANRARKEGLQADLLALRLGERRREMQEENAAALRGLFRAVGKAHEAIPGWAEETIAAWNLGGLGAAAALLRAKSAELRNNIADMIVAAAAEFEPPEKGAEND